MAQTSYPFDTGSTTETQFSQMFRRMQATGVWGTPAGSELRVLADSTGMQVKVPAGFAFVRGHFYSSDAQETLAISAANPTNPRRDLVVLRLDPTANSITLAVVAGTAAASPADPTLTQTDAGVWELPLARVAVAAGATTIAAGNVTDLRAFVGGQFRVWTTDTRPSSPTAGTTVGYNTTLGAPELWNGSAWVDLLPASIPASKISATEQANIAAGRIRPGGDPGASSIRIFVQSGTPTGAAAGDLWFW